MQAVGGDTNGGVEIFRRWGQQQAYPVVGVDLPVFAGNIQQPALGYQYFEKEKQPVPFIGFVGYR